MRREAHLDRAALDRLERRVGPEVLGEIIDLFCAHHEPRMREFRRAQRSGDLEASAEALHSIKSSAAMLGATRLGELARRMETLAREGDLERLAGLAGDLEDSSAAAIESLRERREVLGS